MRHEFVYERDQLCRDHLAKVKVKPGVRNLRQNLDRTLPDQKVFALHDQVFGHKHRVLVEDGPADETREEQGARNSGNQQIHTRREKPFERLTDGPDLHPDHDQEKVLLRKTLVEKDCDRDHRHSHDQARNEQQ